MLYKEMRYYPLFLDLSLAACLVIGAGNVGRRKISTLLESGAASVVALDPFVDQNELQVYLEDSRYRFERRIFKEDDAAGKNLVFVCTSSREANRKAAEACRAQNVLCNVADAPREGMFIVPSHVEAPPLTLALSTGGASPALARALKEDLETWLGGSYVPLARFLERLRPLLLALGLESGLNAEIFRALCAPEFRAEFCAAVRAGEYERMLDLTKKIVPPALHASLKELLHGLD